MKNNVNNVVRGASNQALAHLNRRAVALGWKLDTDLQVFLAKVNGGSPENPVLYMGRRTNEAVVIDRFLTVTPGKDNILDAWKNLISVFKPQLDRGYSDEYMPIARTTTGGYLTIDLDSFTKHKYVAYATPEGDIRFPEDDLTISDLLESLKPAELGKMTMLSIDSLRDGFEQMTLESDLTPQHLRHKQKGFFARVKEFIAGRSLDIQTLDEVSSNNARIVSNAVFTTVMKWRVVVPEGLSVPLSQYMNALLRYQEVASKLETEVLGPYARYLGLVLNNPSILLSRRTGDILNNIISLDLEGARKDIAACFKQVSGPKDTMTIERLLSNSREVTQLVSQYNTMVIRSKAIPSNKIVDRVAEISDYLDNMMEQLEEMANNGDEASREMVELLTRLSYVVSEHIEGYAAHMLSLRAVSTTLQHIIHMMAVDVARRLQTDPIEMLSELAKKNHYITLGRGASESDIQRAEAKLKTTFYEPYRRMLLRYNLVSNVSGATSYTIPHIDPSRDNDVVSVTEAVVRDRVALRPGEWVIFTNWYTAGSVMVCDAEGKVWLINDNKREQLFDKFENLVWALMQ